MHVAGDYIAKRPLDTDLGPFKRTHNMKCNYILYSTKGIKAPRGFPVDLFKLKFFEVQMLW
jgi:hypothetical protein